MTTWLKIAFRNLIKNRRRSLFTVVAIGLGFAAANVFGGFSNYIASSLSDSFIYAQGHGHLTIARAALFDASDLDPQRKLIDASGADALASRSPTLPGARRPAGCRPAIEALAPSGAGAVGRGSRSR